MIDMSLGELEALARKAARGSGLSWGLAEEAGFAVRWLHARGLDGASALAAALPDGAQEIATGTALTDGALTETPTEMAGSLLLKPFTEDSPATETRAKITAETYATLDAFAQRTYAPATEESRLAGAGAGLSDND